MVQRIPLVFISFLPDPVLSHDQTRNYLNLYSTQEKPNMIRESKRFLREQLGLPPWFILVVAGCIAHVAVNAVLRKPVTSALGLIGPIGAGVALEAYEIWVQYGRIGLFAPGNDPLTTILARHALDVLLMVAGPMLIVLSGTIFQKVNSL